MILFQNRLLAQSLQFSYEGGNVTPVTRGEVTPWQTLPCVSVAHISGGEWRIEHEGGPEYSVKSGEAVCLAAGVRHRSKMISEGVSVSRWAHFNLLAGGYLDVFSLVELPPVIGGQAARKLGKSLEHLAKSRPDMPTLEELLQRKIWELELSLLLIGESSPRYDGARQLHGLQRVLPALEAMNSDLAAEYSRESLAALVHLSPSRFAALFREAMGVSPMDYIIKLRMQRARFLLLNSHTAVAQIAREIGYADASYFSRLFKAHYGFSPQEYRATYAA